MKNTLEAFRKACPGYAASIEGYLESDSINPTVANAEAIAYHKAFCHGFDTARADPIDMILFCPVCNKQHIDRPDREAEELAELQNEMSLCSLGDRPQSMAASKLKRLMELEAMSIWINPPHRSHTCRISDGGCGTIWRPADVLTNGVAAITTRGKADKWP